MKKNLSQKTIIPEMPFGIFYFNDGSTWCQAFAQNSYYYYYYVLIC
jgi:hypothetical protein